MADKRNVSVPRTATTGSYVKKVVRASKASKTTRRKSGRRR